MIIALVVTALALAGLYVEQNPTLGMRSGHFGRLTDLVPEAAAVAIFAMTYLVLVIGRLPGFWLDRAGAALVGASLMVALGVLPLEEAPKAIDFDTIILLLGVMIVVANLRLSGFFRLVNGWVVTRARHPIVLLTAVILVSGVLSAFLVNDTICLVLTPLVLDLVTRLRRNPVPYLLAVAMASNIGSTATITGNPQNMIIGSLSHIPYATFAAALWPVAAIGLILTALLIALIYWREFLTHERFPAVMASPVGGKRRGCSAISRPRATNSTPTARPMATPRGASFSAMISRLSKPMARRRRAPKRNPPSSFVWTPPRVLATLSMRRPERPVVASRCSSPRSTP